MSEEMKQSFPNPTCPYCGMNMKSGDGSWWCMDKTCHEQLYPSGNDEKHRTATQTGEAKPVQPWMEAAAKEIKGECCDNQCSNSDIHFVTAIIAAHAPAIPQEWQPIETAPRDGSHFIAANLTPGHIGFGYFEDKAVPFCDVVHYWPNEGEEGFYPSNGPDEPYTFLTHWKPLCTITQ